MRVVVTGATGNVGTSVLRALSSDPRFESLVGLSRRRPELAFPRTTWVQADVRSADLRAIFTGADAVIHLAWLIQPSRDETVTHAVNVEGSRRVFEATAAAGVPSLLYASSVGAYSFGPKNRPVDETWPTNGIETSFYSRHKAAVEAILDHFESTLRVVRLRPGLIFKRDAASEIRRLFIGPLLPRQVITRALIPVVPSVPRLVFQAVHSHDIGRAFHLAATSRVRGAFNIAADPVIDAEVLGLLLDARPVPVPASAVRALMDWTWRARLQPSSPGWFDMALGVPTMDTTRARRDLAWEPEHSATEALAELIEGLHAAAGIPTPSLDAHAGGPGRIRELLTGVGGRYR